MVGSEDSLIRKAGGIQVPMSTLVQAGLTVIIGYLMQMVLGMDARLARQEEKINAIGREMALHADHSAESVQKAEEAHRSIWEALRRKADKR